jgi:putative tricarboxylic transport membrane protein
MQKDLVAAILLLLIAAAYYAASLQISESTLSDEIGPTGLPTVLAGLLAVLAVAIAARALLLPRAAPTAAVGEKDSEAPWPRALGMLVLIALYIPLADFVGYFIALFGIIVGVALYEGMRPSWRLFAVALGGAGFFWVLFDVVLGVRQPTGVLF